MKKILLITGKNAAVTLKKYTKKSRIKTKIHVCNTDVAALISQELIISELAGKNLNDISLILVPGQIKGDVSKISEKLKIPCFKGPTQIADIPLVLDLLPGVKLSTKKSANSILQEEIKALAEKEIKEVYKSKKYSLKIGTVNLGIGITQVLAEIADAPLMSNDEIKNLGIHYKNSGAKIIDIG
ncbi:MAG: hypothetical protein CVT90_03020, partial [Candidatus Altiarchaeales archaeon HGW-Altiarchaeales-3]